MAKPGTNKNSKAGGKSTATSEGTTKSGTPETITQVIPPELMSAKERNELARKKLVAVKAKIRRAIQLQEKFGERKTKKEQAILRAKAGTTKSAEELNAKTEEFDAEVAKLLKENKGLLTEFEVMDGQLGEMDQELKEVRSANKKARKVPEGGRTGGSVAAAKAALVKALARREYIVRYDSDGAAETAKKTVEDVTVAITFGTEDWVTKVGDEEVTHNYGAGAIQIADGLFPKSKKNEAKAA